MHQSFRDGFESGEVFTKIAQHDFTPQVAQPQPPQQQGMSTTGKVLTGLGALGAGVATYKGLRSGGKRLTRVIHSSENQKLVGDKKLDIKRSPKSWFGQKIQELMYGADDIHRVRVLGKGRGVRVEKRKYDPENDVIYASTSLKPSQYISGKHPEIYGSRNSSSRIAKQEARMHGDKSVESDFINQIAPDLHAPTQVIGRSRMRGNKNLQKFHDRFSGQHGDYLIKHRKSVQSGPGGEAFLSSNDIRTYLSGGQIDPKKLEILKQIQQDPASYIAQKKLNLVRSKITGKPIEYRVHTIGDKVLDSHARAFHLDVLGAREARRIAQEYIDRLPEHMKKNKTMHAMDIAKTDQGYKIMETNPGSGMSGFMSPGFMRKKGLTGIPGVLNTIRSNQKLYKHLTGRDAQLTAGIKATGVSGGVAATGYGVSKALGEPSEQTQASAG
jgi:hypothetical protein